MPTPLRIAAISGSLRAASYNSALLRAAASLAPEHTWTFPSIELPLYNADLEAEPGAAVAAFREAVGAADLVLIATPEYNYSIPGGLKNAIDWCSRPAGRAALTRKRVGIVGAAGGPVGTARAQAALRQALFGTLSQVVPYPEFLVGRAQEKFDASGNLTDETTREFLVKYLAELTAWAG